jgi:hypothetical protein
MLSPDHLYRLALTYLVSFLHIIFSFLAFKNDVGFWRGKQNYAGISSRTVIGYGRTFERFLKNWSMERATDTLSSFSSASFFSSGSGATGFGGSI